MLQALRDLPVEIIQVTSDEGRGLINHTIKGLNAHHSSDCFHVLHEIGRGTSGALASAVKKAEKEYETTVKQTQKQVELKENYGDGSLRCDMYEIFVGTVIGVLVHRMLDSLRDIDGSGPKGQICRHYDPQIILSVITYWGTIPSYDNKPKRPPGRRPDFEKKIELAKENEDQAKSNFSTSATITRHSTSSGTGSFSCNTNAARSGNAFRLFCRTLHSRREP